jgi:hypothetical protein
MIAAVLTSIAELLTGLIKTAATKRLERAAKSTEPPLPDGMGTAAAYMAGRTDEQRKGQSAEQRQEMTGDAYERIARAGDDTEEPTQP